MFIIFPAAEAAATLQVDIAEYRRTFGNPVIETTRTGREITEEECFQIIYAMADDAMNAHQLWVPESSDYPQMDAALRKLFPQWQTDGNETPTNHFFREVLDQTTIEVNFWIDLLMVKPSWHVWNIKRMGTDIVLEKGDDYRVLDWNRRMESGEWSDPAYKAAKTRKMTDEQAQIELKNAEQEQLALRMRAEFILRKFNMPSLRHLDEEMLDFLRAQLGANSSLSRKVVFREQRMPRVTSKLADGSVVIYNNDAVDESAVVEQPRTIVEQILEDSSHQTRKKRRGSNG